MVTAGTTHSAKYPRYAGLRMSADEYLALDDDSFRYELINGVVLMSPSPSFPHQRMQRRILQQIGVYVDAKRLGEVVGETDVRFGADLVYRPDVVFYAASRVSGLSDKLDVAPDLIVELLSPGTRAMDLRTKRDDYERFGVREYWVVGRDAAWKFTARDGKYVAEEIKGDRIASEVIAGFVLDLRAAREAAGEEKPSGAE